MVAKDTKLSRASFARRKWALIIVQPLTGEASSSTCGHTHWEAGRSTGAPLSFSGRESPSIRTIGNITATVFRLVLRSSRRPDGGAPADLEAHDPQAFVAAKPPKGKCWLARARLLRSHVGPIMSVLWHSATICFRKGPLAEMLPMPLIICCVFSASQCREPR